MATLVLLPRGQRPEELVQEEAEGRGHVRDACACRASGALCLSLCYVLGYFVDSFSEVVKIDCNLILKKNLNSQQGSFIFSRDTIMRFRLQ